MFELFLSMLQMNHLVFSFSAECKETKMTNIKQLSCLMLGVLDTPEPGHGQVNSAYTKTWYSPSLWWFVFFTIPVWFINWILYWTKVTAEPHFIWWVSYQVAATGFFLFCAFPQLVIITHMRPVYYSDLLIKRTNYADWFKKLYQEPDNKKIVHQYQVIFRWVITVVSTLMLWLLTVIAMMRTGDFQITDAEEQVQDIDWKVRLGILGGTVALYNAFTQYVGKGILFLMTYARTNKVNQMNTKSAAKLDSKRVSSITSQHYTVPFDHPSFNASLSLDAAKFTRAKNRNLQKGPIEMIAGRQYYLSRSNEERSRSNAERTKTPCQLSAELGLYGAHQSTKPVKKPIRYTDSSFDTV